MAVTRFRIRPAFSKDFKDLLNFYLRHRSSVLPLETAKTVGDAIDAGRILLVKPWSGSEIAATGALCQLTPNLTVTYVAELAGMRTTSLVGGMEPISIQQVLLGLRLLGHVAVEQEPILKGATNSIITTVHERNRDSITNIEAMGLKPLVGPFPDWLAYDQIGWSGGATEGTWRCYYADNDSCVRSLAILDGVGLFDRAIRLHRINRNTGRHEDFAFHLELNDLHNAAEDLRAIQFGYAKAALVPPPPSLVFPD
jgi:hypothetical protein